MSVEAIVSGQANVALFWEGEALYSLHPGGEPVRRREREIGYLLGDAKDLLHFQGIDRPRVAFELDLEVRCADALHLALMLLDAELEAETREEAATDLEELFADAKVSEFVESVLYSRPLPGEADIRGAIEAARANSRVATYFSELVRYQNQIAEAWIAWQGIPDELFERSEGRQQALNAAVRSGSFRRLARLLAAGWKMPDLRAETYNPAILRVPNYLAIWGKWIGLLSAVPSRSLEAGIPLGDHDHGIGEETSVSRRSLTSSPLWPRDYRDYDVLIVGAGLAGLSLARQLLLGGVESVLLLERHEFPPKKQKVGEATVQMSGYYYSRVLEMEEHLLRKHYLKYNLRFWWKTPGFEDRAEGYSQSYLRQISNIATYQLDRNVFEEGLYEACSKDPRFTFESPISGLDIDLNNATENADGRHTFRFTDAAGEAVEGTARWVVDAAGRTRFLAKKLGLMTESPIRHGTSFVWVDGLVDAEKLTDLSEPEIRKRPDRRQTGHMPFFLATNHFCGDGYWFWTIPLHGKTSLGLVYDVEKFDRHQVNSADKLIDWVCKTFPLFARDLPHRRNFDHSGFVTFSHDVKQMISPDRWALAGEAGRFSDPLYSPGGDLISTHNTLIADAILRTPTQELLTTKARLYETLARAIYEGYVPSFAVSYNTLGDQEAFSLRYCWELAIYFFFYVFPFINDLFTNLTFLPMYLRRFSKLGPMNASLQRFLADFQRWKLAANLPPPTAPVFFEFSTIGPLKESQEYFYEIGVNPIEARDLLDRALARLDVQSRHAVAHVASTVLGIEDVLRSRAFAERLDVNNLRFDPEELARLWEETKDIPGAMDWGYDPMALRRALGPPVPLELRRPKAEVMTSSAERPAEFVRPA